MNRIVFRGIGVEARASLRDALRQMRDNLRNDSES
jgi:hypothetical protein